jgi:hypothetical protein
MRRHLQTEAAKLVLGKVSNAWFTLDVEASGLLIQSFPLQVGWCGIDGTYGSLLIKPSKNWDMESWDDNAEAMHGISLSQAQNNGVECSLVAKKLNAQLKGAIVLSDGISFDANWLSMIFVAAGLEKSFHLEDAYQWLGRRVRAEMLDTTKVLHAIKSYEHCKSRNHNALEDAKLLLELASKDFA